MIQELSKAEFTAERFTPLALDVSSRQQWPRPFNPNHFFPAVHSMLDSGFLKIWGCEEAVLAGLFMDNLYAGTPEGLILFWWARQGFNAEPLREAFEAESRKRNVVRMMTSICGGVRSKSMERLYRMKGFQPSEIIYSRFLQ